MTGFVLADPEVAADPQIRPGAVPSPLAPEDPAEEGGPTRLSRLVFHLKRSVLRVRRGIQDLDGQARRFPRAGEADEFPFEAGVSRTDLWSPTAGPDPLSERWWAQGKVQNLRAAAAALDGVVIPPGGLFSFWRHVGPPTARRGYARGRMLEQGCMVASVGGGLCQLSNSLYDAALQAGCKIVERHRHSRVVPGSQAALGRDATVAWNDIDLRFRPFAATRLGVVLDTASLWVTLRQTQALARTPTVVGPETPRPAASICDGCGRTACHLHEGRGPTVLARDAGL